MTVPSIAGYVSSYLFDHRDPAYREFSASLMPTVDPSTVVGVRTPCLRRLARELSCRDDLEEFLGGLPHALFEENQVHAFVMSGLRDYDLLLAELERFLPHVDNWATCDGISPRGLAAQPTRTLDRVRAWVGSGDTYVVRFGIGTLMRVFLADGFEPWMMGLVASTAPGDYYVDMMRAWYVAEALVWQRNAALALLRDGSLDRWTHNKAIQKAVESRRVETELKGELRALRRRGPA